MLHFCFGCGTLRTGPSSRLKKSLMRIYIIAQRLLFFNLYQENYRIAYNLHFRSYQDSSAGVARRSAGGTGTYAQTKKQPFGPLFYRTVS